MAFVPALQGIQGHEFHYSRVLPEHDAQFAFRLTRGKGIDDGRDGLISHNTLGTVYSRVFFRRNCKKFHRCRSPFFCT